MLPALASKAEETAQRGRATHCRVTVWAPGIGRSISRSRRLQTANRCTIITAYPPLEGAPFHPGNPQSPALAPLANSHPHPKLCGVPPQPLWVHRTGFRGSRTHTFPVDSTLLSSGFFFFLLCTNHILLRRLPHSHLSPKPQPSPPKCCPGSSFSLSLTLTPNSESST